jgi:hypothetical protein
MDNELFNIDEMIDFETFRNQGTGGKESSNQKIIDYPFDRFIIKVRISPTNEFLGIEGVSINKDFLFYTEKLKALSSKGYHDIDDYYEKIETR